MKIFLATYIIEATSGNSMEKITHRFEAPSILDAADLVKARYAWTEPKYWTIIQVPKEF